MKNIHVFSTDKETRLYLSNYGKELNLASHPKTLYSTGQHIYITNDEEIKEGEYYIHGERLHKHLGKKCLDVLTDKEYTQSSLINKDSVFKKIILTIDQDLIKDGVQAIDDEFLEWFVKNPSCEEVKVEKGYAFGTFYKIIIPKDEHEIYTQDDYFNDEFPKEKPKQETLEEAKYKAYKEYWNENHTQEVKSNFLTAFKLGAKWNQERSYSGEEVLEMMRITRRNEDWTVSQLFEQFKKK